jgi:predicted nuclease of predicted toxin-antitoxin system
MTIWVDAQVSPRIARWLSNTFGVQALPVRDLQLREAEDETIFFAARSAFAVVMTKDIDFVRLLEQHGPPPKVIWLTCGNTSEAELRRILTAHFPEVIRLLDAGDALVEIGPI